MSKVDYPARIAITSMKTGKMSWTKLNWRKEIRVSVVLPVMVQNSESIWSRLFTTSASAAIGNSKKRGKRQAHDFVESATFGDNNFFLTS
jgi:hypothetical protein